MRQSTMKIIKMMQLNEVTEHIIYADLAKRVKGPNGQVLARISEEEGRHAGIWGKYTKEQPLPMSFKIYWYRLLSVIFGITFVITFLMAKPIGAYQLGEAYAQSMGVNIKVFRIALILLSSILSACVTAFAGPISFVGIAVPFLVKQSLGTSRPLVVIPGTFLGGAVFCMMCDLIARMAFAPLELSISTVTSIFGAPVVIFMMLRRKRG